jgi:hypothetical protein
LDLSKRNSILGSLDAGSLGLELALARYLEILDRLLRIHQVPASEVELSEVKRAISKVKMLTTFLISTRAGKKKGEGASSSSSSSSSGLGAGGWVIVIIIVLVAILSYIGVCTIFSRSNPKLRGLPLGLVFLLFLFFGDFYLLYFSLRWGIIGIQGILGRKVVAYSSLPYPRSVGRAKLSKA